jgi:NitT/TauT family transport system permease protein
VLPTVAGFAVLFGLWETVVRLRNVRALILPAPSAIAETLAERPGYWLGHAGATALEAALGFALALAVALGLAVIMVRWRFAERALLPVLTMIQVTPIIALAVPVYLLFRSFGLAPKVVMAALVCLIPFAANALSGLRSVDADTLEVLRAVDAGPTEVLLKLRLPHALPYLFTAARVCVGLALIGALVAEWSGSSEGLGYVMVAAQNNLATAAVWAAVVVLASLGLIGVALVGLVERRALRWRPS